MQKNLPFASPEAEQRRFVMLEFTVELISLHPSRINEILFNENMIDQSKYNLCVNK